MKNQKLKISMNRSNDSSINIEIEDSISGDKLLTGSMSLEAFAKMVTGLGNQPFKADLYSAESFGMSREVRRVEVDVSDIDRGDKDEFLARVQSDFDKKYREDGWSMI